ncbi:hypothetical protein [Streptomyces violaceusniger]|uniref:Uncharacterized protein n=1 Tax=Streptomyces violaceusniger (strain Tu 4113) TaxID=653045 RepID=G2PHS7_STRV4|nr:hypothetical protein [Streptomyces violaceusniger]AEM88878.1 hypothetical protein Strvi_0102 [Streptomyces violaceusniger Tu 4113]
MALDLSRFHATPREIHAALTEALAEDVYLRFQQMIGAAAVREAAEGLREQAGQDRARAAEAGELGRAAEEGAQAVTGAADAVDPDCDGGPWPSVLVRHFGRADEAPEAPVGAGGALRAHGRCQERAPRGSRVGVCDRPLDSLGRCARAGEHVQAPEDAPKEAGEYLFCGADLGRGEPPFTCNRRVAHKGRCSPRMDTGERRGAGVSA